MKINNAMANAMGIKMNDCGCPEWGTMRTLDGFCAIHKSNLFDDSPVGYGDIIRIKPGVQPKYFDEHTCKPYLCTDKECDSSNIEHEHIDNCMHKDCFEEAFKIFSGIIRDLE